MNTQPNLRRAGTAAALAWMATLTEEQLELAYAGELDMPGLYDDEDDEPEHCTDCNGSGEGMYDGTRCSTCRGKGVVYFRSDDDFDGGDE